MNKKEFIETLIDMGGCGAKPKSWARGWDDAIGEVIGIAEELDEPERPVIPKFVADWIEENECLSLIYIGFKLFSNRIKDEEVNNWISNNQEQFCRAFLAWPNVEIEKEKLYRVELPTTLWSDETSELKEYTSFLALDITSDETTFCNSLNGYRGYRTDLTEAQIKAIDARYWAFAEEVTE